MARSRPLLLSVLCVVGLMAQSIAQPSTPATVRVLAIGNSFTNNATKFLDGIGEADPTLTLQIGRATLGGCSLQRHWSLVEQSEKDPAVKPYRVVGVGGPDKVTLMEYLRLLPWDYVTLQQVSYESIDYGTYQPYLDQLAAHIKKHAPQAKIVIHQTWAYRPDHAFLKENDMDQAGMFARLKQAYGQAARRLQCDILPVGAAFQNARSAEGHRAVYPVPGFDAEAAEYPELPDERHSLIAGYSWRMQEGKRELRGDFKHANVRGCYLGGAVWYEALTGRDIRKSEYRPEEIEEAGRRWLKEIAHKTVAEADRIP